MADQVLYSGVACITDLMVKEGLINLDFADVRSVMREMGRAMMGTGEASGEGRAMAAAEAAIANPLLDETSMKGAKGLLISITGGRDLTLFEVDEAATRIREEVDQDANIILGATFDEDLEGVIRVSVVATGIDKAAAENRRRADRRSVRPPHKPVNARRAGRREPPAPGRRQLTSRAPSIRSPRRSALPRSNAAAMVAATADGSQADDFRPQSKMFQALRRAAAGAAAALSAAAAAAGSRRKPRRSRRRRSRACRGSRTSRRSVKAEVEAKSRRAPEPHENADRWAC